MMISYEEFETVMNKVVQNSYKGKNICLNGVKGTI